MSIHDAQVEPWTFPLCPAPPSWALDWRAIEERFAWIQALSGCPQDPIHHAEGDVLAHTRLVAEALVASDAWRALPAPQRSILFAAVLLHDVGKPACTVSRRVGRSRRAGIPGVGRNWPGRCCGWGTVMR